MPLVAGHRVVRSGYGRLITASGPLDVAGVHLVHILVKSDYGRSDYGVPGLLDVSGVSTLSTVSAGPISAQIRSPLQALDVSGVSSLPTSLSGPIRQFRLPLQAHLMLVAGVHSWNSSCRMAGKF